MDSPRSGKQKRYPYFRRRSYSESSQLDRTEFALSVLTQYVIDEPIGNLIAVTTIEYNLQAI
jgi:hypothetical protein